MTEGPLILCENLVKIYKVANLEVVALQGLDLMVQRGELIALWARVVEGPAPPTPARRPRVNLIPRLHHR
jgi:hypothetical protein